MTMNNVRISAGFRSRVSTLRPVSRPLLQSPALRCLAPLAILAVMVATPPTQAAPGRIVTGVEEGPGGLQVKAFTSRTHSNTASFFPYSPSFSGGVRVAVGDINGDGAPDLIAGSGPGLTQIKAFSGRDHSELLDLFPYTAGFAGGVFVAAGDVNGDGFAEVVTGADVGAGPHVKVFSGRTGGELRSFFAYPAAFSGGVRVATGDVNGDGKADIVTGAGAGAGPHVKVFDGVTQAEIRSFMAYPETFTGGVFVSAGDVDGDGIADIVTGTGPGGSPHVKVFNGRTGAEMQSFLAYPASYAGGVRVASGDIDGDGRAEVFTVPGPGLAPEVRVLDGRSGSELTRFMAYPADVTNGVFLGVSSMTAPRLEFRQERGAENALFVQWPSGCACELEENEDPADPRGWKPLDIRPVETGARIGLLLPAVQKVRAYRLKCDEEAVR